MSVHQREARFVVARKIECRRLEDVLGVALLAFIRVRLASELVAMEVGMAVETDQLLKFVDRIFIRLRLAVFGMALLAFEFEVLAFEFERARLMHLASVERRLPLQIVVARGAVRRGLAGLIFSRRELAMMNVFVAIAAFFMLDGLGKIVVLVALRAG